ncbi:MAG: hypothetical protein M1837_005114 [Sclerophora amabilis]|nr:MAG: hypothetical protein M1837_005114 [Sclerophora amabilis]
MEVKLDLVANVTGSIVQTPLPFSSVVHCSKNQNINHLPRYSAHQSSPLFDLTPEIFIIVLTYLDGGDLANLARGCKALSFNHFVRQALWEEPRSGGHQNWAPSDRTYRQALWDEPRSAGHQSWASRDRTHRRLRGSFEVFLDSLHHSNGPLVRRIVLDPALPTRGLERLGQFCPQLTSLDLSLITNARPALHRYHFVPSAPCTCPRDPSWAELIRCSPALFARLKFLRFSSTISVKGSLKKDDRRDVDGDGLQILLKACPALETLALSTRTGRRSYEEQCELARRIVAGAQPQLKTLQLEESSTSIPSVEVLLRQLESLEQLRTVKSTFNRDIQYITHQGRLTHRRDSWEYEWSKARGPSRVIDEIDCDSMATDVSELTGDAYYQMCFVYKWTPYRLSNYLIGLRRLVSRGWNLRALDYGQPTLIDPSGLYDILSHPDKQELMKFLMELTGWNPVFNWFWFTRDPVDKGLQEMTDPERKTELARVHDVFRLMKSHGIPVRVEHNTGSLFSHYSEKESETETEYLMNGQDNVRRLWDLASVGFLVDEFKLTYFDERVLPTEAATREVRERGGRLKEARRFRAHIWKRFADVFPNLKRFVLCIPESIHRSWSSQDMVRNLPGAGWTETRWPNSYCDSHGTLVNITFSRREVMSGKPLQFITDRPHRKLTVA